MRLLKLAGRGLRTFDDPFELDLPERGLVQIVGPSGVGKSTLLGIPAATLGLGGVPPATKLQSWHGTALRTRVVVQEGDKVLDVDRDGKLKLKVDGVAVKGGATALEERLRQELGMPLEVMRLGYRVQRTGSYFLSLSDDKKKAFMAEHAGIPDGLEARLKLGAEGVATAERLMTDTAARLDSARAAQAAVGETGLEAAEVALLQAQDDAARTAQQATEARRQLVTAQAAQKAARAEAFKGAALAEEQAEAIWKDARQRQATARAAVFDPVEAELDNKLKAVRSVIETITNAEQIRKNAHYAQRQKVLQDAAKAAEARVTIGRLKDRLASDRAEEAKLTGTVPECVTCARPWPEGTKQRLGELRHNIQRTLATLGKLEEDVASAPDPAGWEAANPWVPDERLDKLRQADVALAAKLSEMRVAMSAAQASRTARVDAEVEAAARDLEAARRARTALFQAPDGPEVVAAAHAEQTARQAHEFSSRMLEERRAAHNDAAARALRRTKLGEAVVRAEAEHTVAVQVHAERADTYDAVRAFVGRWFDEMLAAVADAATRLLASVPNVAGCTLNFKPGAEGKAVVPVLSINGHEVGIGPLDGASGGMLSSIHLAVDLGVLAVIEERTGRRLGWLAVDEALEGLNEASRTACLEILRHQARERLVLLIDHFSEVGGLADMVVRVVSENGRARIVKE